MNDYKINPKSIPETTKFVRMEITDKDVLSESRKTLEDLVMESYKHALREGIEANTVILDKNFCKVNGFDFLAGGWDYQRLPPMICGLEIRGVSDGELPEGYNFSVLEATMTAREALIRDTVDGMYHRLKHELTQVMTIREFGDDSPNMNSDDVFDILDRVIDIILKRGDNNG